LARHLKTISGSSDVHRLFTVAYLANRFPSAVEPYVSDEIQELRSHGVQVIAGSVRTCGGKPPKTDDPFPILYLQPVQALILLQAVVLAVRRWKLIAGLVKRVLLQGRESPARRAKALLHTWLGAYYAVQLRGHRVDHIHVHHGYFGSWVAMVAARLLGVSYSLTLHGSDLFLHSAYLDAKLERCLFCGTVSEYNRRYILEHFPAIEAAKIAVLRLGVGVPSTSGPPRVRSPGTGAPIALLAVGRLHPVKDHAFLVHGCANLRDAGIDFTCAIAGDGPERLPLEKLIRERHLQSRVALLGHVARSELDTLYQRADVVLLTSRSEGIPLVLMEAMACGKLVLAPAITGIPELVISGKTGFLYTPGVAEDFVEKLLFLRDLIREGERFAMSRLDWVRHAARVQVLHNFNRTNSLAYFSDRFLERIATQ
jgi:colanic acid/amylovoran biosynthesis glycosyltransferase